MQRKHLLNKSCKSCGAIFKSTAQEDEDNCKNCREDSQLQYQPEKDFFDIVNNTCRTSPVFYE